MDALDPAKLSQADIDGNFYVVLYKTLLSDPVSRVMIRDVIVLISERLAAGAVAFNCAAGKDRTGVIAMLLLLAAGVDNTDIIADYQVSDTYITHIWPEHRTNPSSKSVYMAELLDFMHETYTDIDGYFTQIGVAREQTDAIRRAMLA